MKNVTEFPNYKLLQAIKIKSTLTTEGKTPEEILQNLGETFKLEGDKLKYLSNAADVASQNTDKLVRVLVVSLGEGENPPAKATKIEEHCYIPEYPVAPKPPEPKSTKGPGGKRGGGGGRDGGKPKGSPWGMTPEEKEAKKNAGKVAAAKAKKE